MKYEKPEIVTLGSAVEQVQASLAKQGILEDCLSEPTSSTYAASE